MRPSEEPLDEPRSEKPRRVERKREARRGEEPLGELGAVFSVRRDLVSKRASGGGAGRTARREWLHLRAGTPTSTPGWKSRLARWNRRLFL